MESCAADYCSVKLSNQSHLSNGALTGNHTRVTFFGATLHNELPQHFYMATSPAFIPVAQINVKMCQPLVTLGILVGSVNTS